MVAKLIEHDNSKVRQYLVDGGFVFMADCPSWLDDVITGAARLNESVWNTTKPTNTGLILQQLLSHDVISSKVVRKSVSRKSMAIEGREISDRYARVLSSRIISASKSIAYHLERGAV